MDLYELINTRYSVRAYRDEPVPEDVIRRVLEAGRLAPSAANFQPWHFFVVRDQATRQKLFPDQRQAWVAAAPVVIVACSFPGKAWVRGADGKNHADIDIAIAMEHMVLAATQEGLGTCWVCAFDPGVIRKALDLSPEVDPVAMVPLGYPASTPPSRKRKSLDEIVTWI